MTVNMTNKDDIQGEQAPAKKKESVQKNLRIIHEDRR
jgi:hypothetical protein